MGTGVFRSSGIITATLPNSLKTTGDYTFYTCANLKSVTIPDSITNIGQFAFVSCSNLKNISIPYLVNTIGQNAFQSCTNLRSVIIPDSVTSLGTYAFAYCDKLASIKLSKNITTCPTASIYGTSITNIIIPQSVASIGDYTIADSTKLMHVYFLGNIPTISNTNNFNTSNDTAYYFSTAGSVGNLGTYFTNKVVLTYPINVEAILYSPTTNATPTGIYVSWVYSGTVTNYVVSIINSSNVVVGTVSTTDLFTTITTNLTDGEIYTFTVKVNNNGILSEASPVSNTQLFTNNLKYSFNSVSDANANVSGYQNTPTIAKIVSQIRINIIIVL